VSCGAVALVICAFAGGSNARGALQRQKLKADLPGGREVSRHFGAALVFSVVLAVSQLFLCKVVYASFGDSVTMKCFATE
jgi:hypothetical protein